MAAGDDADGLGGCWSDVARLIATPEHPEIVRMQKEGAPDDDIETARAFFCLLEDKDKPSFRKSYDHVVEQVYEYLSANEKIPPCNDTASDSQDRANQFSQFVTKGVLNCSRLAQYTTAIRAYSPTGYQEQGVLRDHPCTDPESLEALSPLSPSAQLGVLRLVETPLEDPQKQQDPFLARIFKKAKEKEEEIRRVYGYDQYAQGLLTEHISNRCLDDLVQVVHSVQEDLIRPGTAAEQGLRSYLKDKDDGSELNLGDRVRQAEWAALAFVADQILRDVLKRRDLGMGRSPDQNNQIGDNPTLPGA